MNLEIHGPGSVGHHVILADARRQVDTIGPPRKQIHGGCAEKRKLGGADRLLQARILGVEDDNDLNLRICAPAHDIGNAAEIEKQKPAGKREVLLQKPIALEGSWTVRKQCLLVVEPERAHTCLGYDLTSALAGASRAGNQRDGVGHEQLVKSHGNLIAAAQKDR